jgi:hypothetical protein
MNFEKLIEAKQGSNTDNRNDNRNDDNDNIENIRPVTDQPILESEQLEIEQPIPDTETTDIDNNTELGLNNNQDQSTYTELDLNTKRVKLYLELLDDNHHYFINYNDCYTKGQLLLDLIETNNSQELKNTIKMKLTKYKKSKNITFETGITNIDIIDNKTKNKVDNIELPYCLDLKELLDKYENKLSGLYINCQRKYDTLIKEPQNDENELAEFRKMRGKLEKKINEFYTLQYAYNNIKKKRNNDNHYILHNAKDTYCASKGDTKFLLQLTNSSINAKSLAYLLDTEVTMLNSYNDILLDISNSKSSDMSKETKEKIKEYIELKNSLGKNIKKLLNIKTVVKRGVIYMYNKDKDIFYNSIISNYIRSLNRNVKSHKTETTSSDNINSDNSNNDNSNNDTVSNSN